MNSNQYRFMSADNNSIVQAEEPKGNVVIYTSEDGKIRLDVQIGGETVWLTTQQMSMLFDRDDSNIRKHITKIFSDGELVRENNVHFLPVNGVKKPVLPLITSARLILSRAFWSLNEKNEE